MNLHAIRPSRISRITPVLFLIALGAGGPCLAADPGRLFYTPAERAQLEAARAGNVTHAKQPPSTVAQPLHFDGIIIRSDGRNTSWVNGQPRAISGVAGLKPGQVRADGKVYEPYQVLRPGPGQAVAEGAAP